MHGKKMRRPKVAEALIVVAVVVCLAGTASPASALTLGQELAYSDNDSREVKIPDPKEVPIVVPPEELDDGASPVDPSPATDEHPLGPSVINKPPVEDQTQSTIDQEFPEPSEFVIDPEQGIVSFELDKSETFQGEYVQVSGQCALFGYPTASAFLLIYSEEFLFLTEPQVDSYGRFNQPIEVPRYATPGTYDVFLSCSLADAIFGHAQKSLTILKSNSPKEPQIIVESPVMFPTTNGGSGQSETVTQPTISSTPMLANTGSSNMPSVSLLSSALIAATGALFLSKVSTRRRTIRAS